jgi:hypothetical protein
MTGNIQMHWKVLNKAGRCGGLATESVSHFAVADYGAGVTANTDPAINVLAARKLTTAPCQGRRQKSHGADS